MERGVSLAARADLLVDQCTGHARSTRIIIPSGYEPRSLVYTSTRAIPPHRAHSSLSQDHWRLNEATAGDSILLQRNKYLEESYDMACDIVIL